MDTWNTRLKEARELRRMSQAELARACHVSAPTASDWESGRIKMLEAPNLLTICKVLRLDPNWLIFGIDKSKAPITEPKTSLSPEAESLISWVTRVDGLGGLAPKLFANINAALQVAGALTRVQNSQRDEAMADVEASMTSRIAQTEGKERADKRRKP